MAVENALVRNVDVEIVLCPFEEINSQVLEVASSVKNVCRRARMKVSNTNFETQLLWPNRRERHLPGVVQETIHAAVILVGLNG